MDVVRQIHSIATYGTQANRSPRWRALSPARRNIEPTHLTSSSQLNGARETYPTPFRVFGTPPSPRRMRALSPAVHSASTRAVAADSVDSKLIAAARQIRDHFFPGVGRHAESILVTFAKSLHLPAADRDVLMTALSRCTHYMSNVEWLLRDAVKEGTPVDRTTVHYAYMRWSECQLLVQKLLFVLRHRAVVGRLGSELSGGAQDAMRGSCLTKSGRASSPQLSQSTNPRLPSAATLLPSYGSVASRWKQQLMFTSGVSAVTSRVQQRELEWQSAADAYRERRLHELQSTLLASLASVSAAHVHVTKALSGIRLEFDKRFGEQEGEASFLLWLGSQPPPVVAAMEEAMLHESENEGAIHASPPRRGLSKSLSPMQRRMSPSPRMDRH